ncbi:MAG: hypothetical protein ACRDZW_05675 [Acidimicrobiales bacterium]
MLGIEVTQRDDGSAHRMPDALFRLPNGWLGALEVTTICEQQAIEREATAVKTEWQVDGAKWAWMIHVGRGVVMRDLQRHLPTLVLTCERHGATDPRRLPFEHSESEAFEWLASSDLSLHGFAETNRPGAIDVLPDGGGGAVYEHLDELPQWVGGRLREPDLAENIDKLRSSDRAELHLFLRIHDTAMPFSLYHPLAFGAYVPTAALDAPDGLTGLWLAPAWRNPILWWSSHAGWRREHCFD